MSYPDALVFKIVDTDQCGKPDNVMYIWHDSATGCYYIRGKRTNGIIREYNEYSFCCVSVFHLVDFISFAVDRLSDLSYTLYNFENLPEDSDEITFEFLTDQDHYSREISGYDTMKYSRKRLAKIFRMMRGVHN